MIKKIFLFTILIFSIFFTTNNTQAQNCIYTEGGEISSMLTSCKAKTLVGSNNTDFTLDATSGSSGLKTIMIKWIKNITTVLVVLAVASLVYAGLLFQLRNGEDEKINKAKGIVKWVLIGTLLMVSASGIIVLVIGVIYGLAGG